MIATRQCSCLIIVSSTQNVFLWIENDQMTHYECLMAVCHCWSRWHCNIFQNSRWTNWLCLTCSDYEMHLWHWTWRKAIFSSTAMIISATWFALGASECRHAGLTIFPNFRDPQPWGNSGNFEFVQLSHHFLQNVVHVDVSLQKTPWTGHTNSNKIPAWRCWRRV